MLTFIVFLPALAGLLVMLFPERLARWIAGAFTLAVFLLGMYLYFGLLKGSATNFGDVANPAWAINVPWINITSGGFHFQVNYALGADGLSIPLIILNGLLSFLAVVGSWNTEKRPKFFFMLLLILESGVMGVFAASDLFLFFLFWEVELIPMFLLIGIWGGPRREYAAWKFLLYTLVGSSFTLAGIFLLYVRTGAVSASFQYFAAQAASVGGNIPLFGLTLPMSLVIFLLIFAGFAVKIPMWPVHTWLPDAHTEAPTAVSVLLAGVLLKMGAYGLIRICLGFVPHGAMIFAPVLGVIAAINVLWGAGASMVQGDMKKMIAYASVSHMGYVLLGVAGAAVAGSSAVGFRQAALTGATLQMFTHGAITGMLFFAVGVVYEKAHTREIDIFGGIAVKMPNETFLYSIACFASLGLPALAGFVAEYLVFTGAFALLPVATVFAAFGVVLTAGYLLWMLRRAFYGPLNLKWSWLTDARTVPELLPLVALTAVILFVGIYPQPIVDFISPALQSILHTVQGVAVVH
ncbi:MAG TPA: NADH-quinone oxidoreductase subunit M [Ktedonobacterales bacterium]|nr:NADH-quinone oxidoreductase subunit M [Ktedonobacterales bacterium]